MIRRSPAEAASCILSVAVCLLLAFAGGNALFIAAADDASVRVANACSEAAEDFAVMVAPAPNSTMMS
jgi:hypothetical protein